MRGDAPASPASTSHSPHRSPHARGCTANEIAISIARGPFPACAGMHRERVVDHQGIAAVPRMRGDAPQIQAGQLDPAARSPHARGCTARAVVGDSAVSPFPACAGMHRWSPARAFLDSPVPRMRGDAPVWTRAFALYHLRSPHARGCTVQGVGCIVRSHPFPACAGMHRRAQHHARGGRAVPRMRGDAPADGGFTGAFHSRSPHARGCTEHRTLLYFLRDPFPACAGMHRSGIPQVRWTMTVPRMRGDAPETVPSPILTCCRSPHARGCTGHRSPRPVQERPFPACAGMHRQSKK